MANVFPMTLSEVRRGVRNHPSLPHVSTCDVNYICKCGLEWKHLRKQYPWIDPGFPIRTTRNIRHPYHYRDIERFVASKANCEKYNGRKRTVSDCLRDMELLGEMFQLEILEDIGYIFGTKCRVCGNIEHIRERDSFQDRRFCQINQVFLGDDYFVGPSICDRCRDDIWRFSFRKNQRGLDWEPIVMLWVSKVITGKNKSVEKRRAA